MGNVKPTAPLMMKIVLLSYVSSVCKLQGQLTKVPTDSYDGCLCPGDVVMYECIVNETANIASIIWKGSALSCPNTKNEIQLPLNNDRSPLSNLSQNYEDVRSCNDGGITGKIIREENDTSCSQLNVTLTDKIAGKSIKCAYDNGQSETIVGSLSLPDGVGLAPTKPEDTEIHWMAVCNESSLTFSWSPFSTNSYCSTFHYSLTSLNCGSCPTMTTHTNITCTGAPMNGSVCTLTIQATVCGNTTSEPLQLRIQPGCAHSRGMKHFIIILGASFGIVCTTVLVVIVVILILWRRCKTTKGTDKGESIYEDVKETPLSQGHFDAELTHNVAYGYTSKRSPTTAM